MATLEDKILGDKLHNYCSSSEGSGDDTDDEDEKKNIRNKEEPVVEPDVNKWEGTSSNTGPKGVIKDWQRYKQLEIEKHKEDDRERIELMKKLTLTVQTALDEEKEKASNDPDLEDLLNDDFLLEYQKKRMQEMLEQSKSNIIFGKLIYLRNGQEYLDAIDKENKNVKVIIHLYEENIESCRAMNSCLIDLSKIYKTVKFCSIIASRAGLSSDFKINGLPALLIYKAGQLVGNFVRLTDDIGDDFCAEDVQNFLVEHGMLEDKSCKPILIRNGDHNDSDD